MKKFIVKNIYLIIILIAASALRLYKLDYQSLWLDELFSVTQANPNHSFAEIFAILKADDPHPPLYYYCLKICFTIFGYSSFTARLFSAVIGIAGIVALYSFTKELMNKRAALIACVLITINSFHLLYSQEARMYSLLFLTTILSFHALVIFIKRPTLKTAIIYSLATTLMIYSQFFGLFTLVSQLFILLFFTVKPYNIKWQNFFKYSVISGFTITILYIPALYIFFQNLKRKSTWIPQPGDDVYTLIFKEFFGNSEIVIAFIIISILFYFSTLTKNREAKTYNLVDNKNSFSAFILIIWVITTLAIPFIRSYTSYPIIISRYFINVIPAVIVIAAIGISQIKSKAVQGLFVSIIVLFSITDIFIVKKYYKTLTKTQFREVTDFIKNSNGANAPIVSNLAFYYSFYFKDVPNQEIIEMDVNQYVSKIAADTSYIKPFWVTSAHNNPFTLSDETRSFLDKKYELRSSITLVDSWANYYVPSSSQKREIYKSFDLEKFSPIASKENSGLQFFQNSSTKSHSIHLEKGNYSINFIGESYPVKPLKNVNAHFTVKLNNKMVGGFYLGEPGKNIKPSIDFVLEENLDISIELTFDNDDMVDDIDRNGIISKINIIKN